MAKKKRRTQGIEVEHKRSHRQPRPPSLASANQRMYTIPDYRLEKPSFTVRQVRTTDGVSYQLTGALDAPVPPIRESRYLSRKQHIEIYRWMLLNRKMEAALENLYKQGKVVGGVYFGLGQEACSCASAYALNKEDWLGPMIRNQGSMLVRGFSARDIMMQYMAKSGSPTHGKDGTSHYGDIEKRQMVSPISMLGDLLPVMAGVSMGARIQGNPETLARALGHYPPFSPRRKSRHVLALAQHTFYVATVHPQNTSPKRTDSFGWHPFPLEEIRRLLHEDWSFYES